MNEQQGSELNRLSQQDPSLRAQEAMLRMARDLQAQGHVHEALDMYTNLIEDYPGTQASVAASNAMVELAVYLEQQGMPRSALEVYHKLEELQ
ncbi:MAG TPA: tetratricopeptide repeat protein [Ktedonobacterales bacterium]